MILLKLASLIGLTWLEIKVLKTQNIAIRLSMNKMIIIHLNTAMLSYKRCYKTQIPKIQTQNNNYINNHNAFTN